MASGSTSGAAGSGGGTARTNSTSSVPAAGRDNSSAVVGSSSTPTVRRNAAGSRNDVAWQYGVSIDGDARRIKCKFCERTVTGGVYRLKHHLAGTSKDVIKCIAVPDDVKKQMFDIVRGLQQNLIKKSGGIIIEDCEEIGETRKRQVESSQNIFKKRGVSSQATINTMFKKNLREDACRVIARFFYNNGVPFNVARSEEFVEMCEAIARHGQGFKPPSYHEIRVKYLKEEVNATKQMLEEHKAEWKKMGCTIMTDGWTDKRRRTLINFLVHSPKGTVFLKSIDASKISKTADKVFKMMDDIVEEVGEENVVQIVTDNAANYKAAGEMLMNKRKGLYWTPCAAHCIDLILEDFEKKVPLHQETIPKGRKITTYIYSRTSLIVLLQNYTKGRDLVRPGITRFATSYLTLGSLNDYKGALIRMFTCDEWKNSRFARTRDGRFIEDIILDKVFWKDIITCLKGAIPLMKVLRLVDSDEKPAMGYIYEAMDQAKEQIQSAFNGVQTSYMPLWDIIDQRWDQQLHRPLHAAGYFLNPQLHYGPGFKVDGEVKRGLYECMTRMVPDPNEQAKIDVQLDDFKRKLGMFGSNLARLTLDKKQPALWWESYGDEHPELQKFAIRILSLTCSSSGCERNWSAFEMLYEYQFNMGLLLIEKKEWNSKYTDLSPSFVEVKDALEREKAAHLIALSEAEKREENLRKALGVEKECVFDLEKALREMRSENAKIKFTADSKLAEANALIASIEDKSLEVQAKLRSADAKFAEISRKSSEIDRKSQDLEGQESALRRERLSFIAEQEAHESTLSKQREDLREWEKKLQEGEERLAKGQRILNEREQRANENDRICRQKEKDLEEAQKNIDVTNETLRSKEDDVNIRISNITLREKECDSMKMNLDLKEKELSAWEEKLNANEKVEIQKLVDEHNAILDVKKQDFEVELSEKRKSFEDGLKNRLVEVEKKEDEINHMEDKVAKREQALEKKAEKLKEKEKEYDLKVKALKEREKSVKSEEKNLEMEKRHLESEREELLRLKAEVEKIRANNEEELLRINEETNRLKVTEEDRSEYLRLQSQLKHEIDQYRMQKELLLKETDDLRQQKETFEREWDELDLKRADVEKEMKNVVQQKEELLKLQQFEEEKLKNEKQATQDYVQRELETLKLAKESFAAEMELEKSSLAEKAQSEKNQMLLDFELRKKELEADMQNQLEQKENDLLERRKLFEEKRESELNNINFLREVANREMEEMKLQRSKLEREKEETDENKKHLERQRTEMQEDIDVLVDLNRKLKNQREQFIMERRRFIEFVEKLRSCQNCWEMISEFVLSDLQFSADIENLEVPSLPKVAGDIIQGGSDVNLAFSRQNTGVSPATYPKSPVSGGTLSFLRKCKSFFKSPIRKNESEDVGSLRDVTNLADEKAEDSLGRITGTENEAGLSFAVANDSFDAQKAQSGNDITAEVEADHDPSIDSQSNIGSKAPEDLQPPDSKVGQQKPRKGGGRARVKRTNTVKTVLKEAEAILGESKAAQAVPGESVDDRETEFPNGNPEDSADVNSESQKPSNRRKPVNVRKRNRVQTSQMTASGHDGDASEGHSDSIVPGQRKRRRQKAAAPPVQTARETRYNLR